MLSDGITVIDHIFLSPYGNICRNIYKQMDMLSGVCFKIHEQKKEGEEEDQDEQMKQKMISFYLSDNCLEAYPRNH